MFPFSFIGKVVFTVTVIKQEERPQPLISLFASQSLSDDLHNTERTDLKKQILGVCILPKDKVNVA